MRFSHKEKLLIIARRISIGLLWLSVAGSLFATSMAPVDPSSPEGVSAALTAKINNPRKALDELCFEPPYFMVLLDPTDSNPVDLDPPDYSGVLPSTATVDVGSLTPPPASLALSGASLIIAGLVRRRTRV